MGGSLDSIDRSGYAREATALLISLGKVYNDNESTPQTAEFTTALDYVASYSSPIPGVLNDSASRAVASDVDKQCLGDTWEAIGINEVFEHCTLPVVAAGNERQWYPWMIP